MLEMINRLRANPQMELQRLLDAHDPEVDLSLTYYRVDLDLLKSEFAVLRPAPPLAWSDVLAGTALAHSKLLQQNEGYLNNPFPGDGTSIHQLPGEPDPYTRVVNAGYFGGGGGWSGENVPYAWSSVLAAHANMVIDWGPGGTGGMQAGRGHRANLLTPNFPGNGGPFREIGIGIVQESGGAFAGKLIITQDLGLRG
jgi:uncharacterized protein YkwD